MAKTRMGERKANLSESGSLVIGTFFQKMLDKASIFGILMFARLRRIILFAHTLFYNIRIFTNWVLRLENGLFC